MSIIRISYFGVFKRKLYNGKTPNAHKKRSDSK